MGEVGKSQVRVDAFDKATGRTKYYEDLMPQNALYVRIKHAEIAHGFVKSVDTSAAEAITGVVKVITCFDVPDIAFPTAGHPAIRTWPTAICSTAMCGIGATMWRWSSRRMRCPPCRACGR